MAPDDVDEPVGGGFNPPVPTARGGPDYGRFVEAVRTLQDLTRGADAPDDVVTKVADLIESANDLLAPHLADEWHAPSGRRFDLPNRGSILSIPVDLTITEDRHVRGTALFRRFHLGRNGAVHGGSLAHLFDSLLGFTAFKLSGSQRQRTAFLHVNYRRIVPVDTELQVDAWIDRIEARKIFVAGRVTDGSDGDTVLCEAEALFLKLLPGQP